MTDPVCLTEVSVSEIGWAQDSISAHFRDGRNVHEEIGRLNGLTEDERRSAIGRIPRIRVVRFETQGWITLDNRRLYILRAVLRPGTLITVQVATYDEAMELKRKLTTRNEGKWVIVRNC